jgi:ketosteroid isomerase-like protein
MTKERALELINIYGKAWETQDAELIASIFTDEATYNDPVEPENMGISAIKEYWKYKVIGEQKNIKFDLKNIWMDGDTVIAEWNAKFDDIKRNININMTEVAIFTVENNKFSSLREYYKDVKTDIN